MVSIIMPVYNGEKFIAEAIGSVINQLYSQWELIIIDDGSTDKTITVIREFAKNERRIKIIQNKQNLGQGFSRNIGIKSSTYDWVSFLDSDDLWEPQKLQRQFECLQKHPFDICSSDAFAINSEGIHISDDNILINITQPLIGNDFFLAVFNKNILSNSIFLVKKEVLFKAGLYKETGLNSRRSEDYDLYLRIAKVGVTFYPIHEYLVKHRKHSNNSSKSFLEMRLAELSVLNNYKKDNSIPFRIRQKKLVALYYDLLNLLIKENRFEEAKAHARSMIKWDRLNLKSWLKYLLIHISPYIYKRIQKNISMG